MLLGIITINGLSARTKSKEKTKGKDAFGFCGSAIDLCGYSDTDMTQNLFFDMLSWIGAVMGISGVLYGFYLLAKGYTGKRHGIALSLGITGATMMIIVGAGIMQEKTISSENDYQILKPSLDAKSCEDLEKVMSFGLNKTMIAFSKRNYNERCINP